MNIAFFVSEFPTVTETFIVNQIIGLKKKNHKVDIFSQAKLRGIPIHEMIVNYGLLEDVIFLDAVPKNRFHKIASLLSAFILKISIKNLLLIFRNIFANKSVLSIYDFIPFLRKPDYDIVHAHFGVNGKYVAQLKKLGLFKKAKFITTFHGYDLNEVFAKNHFYNDLFEECSNFTVNSNYSKSRLLKFGVREKEIDVLPTGLSLKNFQLTPPLDNDSDKIKLIFVGRLIKLKGPDLFIEICRLLRQSLQLKFRADIIGEGALLDELQLLICKYNLSDVITLQGNCDQSNVIRLMQQSNILLMPGIRHDGKAETQGLVIQEAQAMQLPVIVSDAGGMKEGMIDGVTGFVVSEGDINGFVEKIELLACDPALRKRMGEAGRKFVEENFDINILNERLIQIYLN